MTSLATVHSQVSENETESTTNQVPMNVPDGEKSHVSNHKNGHNSINVGVVNKHVSGKVINGKVVMLYSLEDGPCHQSFGVHVAGMFVCLIYSCSSLT